MTANLSFLQKSAIALSAAVSLALTGCNDESSGGSSTSTSNLSAFSISDAKALMIGPDDGDSETKAASNSSSDVLLKVTDGGYVEEVTATDENGEEITTSNAPDAIYEVNTKYVVVGFPTTHYLVRKEDGAAFRLELDPSDLGGERLINRSLFRTDESGNIYFPSTNEENNTSVYKISGAGSDEVTRERVTPEEDNVYSFAVGDDGEVAYIASPQPRIVAPSGGLKNISNEAEAVWETPEGELRFNDEDLIKGASTTNDGSIAVSDLGNFSNRVPFSLRYFLHEVNGKLYLIEYRDSNDQLVRELPNDSSDPKLLDWVPLESVKAADSSGSHLYLAGTTNNDAPQLLKIDPESEETQTLLSDNYDIYELAVSNSDEITFSATRMRDGARVIGEVDSDGNLEISKEDLNDEISVLVRVR